MRLDKYISHFTDLSRKDVKRVIKARNVSIDGSTVTDPSMHINEQQIVTLNGEIIASYGPRYFMLNKPPGYVCATRDGEHPTVLDLLEEPRKSQLQIAGRLDIDTTGLVLITDDGQWNHRITSPQKACGKVYDVELAEDLPEDAGERFLMGILLDGEKKPTLPAQLKVLYRNEASVTLHEGKYHQVKRMFAAIGNRVVALHRRQIGRIVLDTTLEPGEYRALTSQEINSINQAQNETPQ